jgi:hypothetical protein
VCVIADELGVDCIQVSITSMTTSTTSRRLGAVSESELNSKSSLAASRAPITAKLPIGYGSNMKITSVTIKPDSSNSPSLSVRRRLADAVVIEYEGEFA